MSADIIQIRDWQSKRDLERMNAEFEKQAMEIANIAFSYVWPDVRALRPFTRKEFEEWRDAAPSEYHAPEKDPA